MKTLYILCILLIQFFNLTVCENPCETLDHDTIKPCKCIGWSIEPGTKNWEIDCSSDEPIDLKTLFTEASKKNNVTKIFDIFKASPLPSSILQEDTFADFKFKIIKIEDSNITSIDPNAFKSTLDVTDEIELVNNQFGEDLLDGKQLFDVIKKFKNLKALHMRENSLFDIPKDAFKQSSEEDVQRKLSILRFGSNKINKIGDFAFYDLPNITWLDFAGNNLSMINANTFAFIEESEKPIQIDLDSNQLHSESFADGSFYEMKRPSVMFLRSNKLTYLREHIFANLLRSGLHKIFPSENPFVCDCNNRWILQDRKAFKDHLESITCEDGQVIWEKNLNDYRYCDIKENDLVSGMGNLFNFFHGFGIINEAHKKHLIKLLNNIQGIPQH